MGETAGSGALLMRAAVLRCCPLCCLHSSTNGESIEGVGTCEKRMVASGRSGRSIGCTSCGGRLSCHSRVVLVCAPKVAASARSRHRVLECQSRIHCWQRWMFIRDTPPETTANCGP